MHCPAEDRSRKVGTYKISKLVGKLVDLTYRGDDGPGGVVSRFAG